MVDRLFAHFGFLSQTPRRGEAMRHPIDSQDHESLNDPKETEGLPVGPLIFDPLSVHPIKPMR